MPRKRTATTGLATDASTGKTVSAPAALARPKILNGKAMPPVELPSNFDLTVHERLRVAGGAKPVTRSELAERISALNQKKSRLG